MEFNQLATTEEITISDAKWAVPKSINVNSEASGQCENLYHWHQHQWVKLHSCQLESNVRRTITTSGGSALLSFLSLTIFFWSLYTAHAHRWCQEHKSTTRSTASPSCSVKRAVSVKEKMSSPTWTAKTHGGRTIASEVDATSQGRWLLDEADLFLFTYLKEQKTISDRLHLILVKGWTEVIHVWLWIFKNGRNRKGLLSWRRAWT